MMNIKIDEILQRLTPAEVSALWDNTTAESFNAWDLAVGDFCKIIDNANGVVEWCEENIKAGTVAEWFAKTKGVADALSDVVAEVNKLDMPMTAEEQQAIRGVDFLTFSQSVICDTVVFFGLKSTEEAEVVPVADWFIFAKKRHAEELFRKNYEKIVQKKYAKR